MRSFTNTAGLRLSAWACALCLAGVAPVSAQIDPTHDSVRVYILEPLTVEGRIDNLAGQVSSASVGYVGYRDLRRRPIAREGELLETVPGMILTQHSGSGKSNQMFVRGFNLDHGTDFSTRLEGIPINLSSHAHGQGYTDVNFLIPELVDHIGYSLGNYYAEIGDFGSAGGADIRLRRSLEQPLFSLGFGENGHRRVVGAASIAAGSNGTLLAGTEFRGYDGPWDIPEQLRKVSGMLRYSWSGRTSSLSVLAMGYDNSWDASDQIPRRAVESGEVDRFGQVDPTLGGETSRYGLSGSWSRSTESSSQQIDLYAVRYSLDLFSNFTYLLDNPLMGDQIRQVDDGRWTFGANLRHLQPVRVAGREHEVTVGAQLKLDRADVSLFRTEERVEVSTVRADQVSQSSGGLFVEVVSPWSSVFRSTLGLRGDAYVFDVTSDDPRNSGSVNDGIVSPKLSLAFGPWGGTEFYLSGGLGFHSNDARGAVATIDPATGDPALPVDPLVRSVGAEVGVRSTPLPGLRSTLSVWTIELDSELLFVGDAGATEPSDASRRVGVTWANFYRISPQWSADVDLSVTRARLLGVPDGENRIPGALENVIAAGLSYEPVEDGPHGAIRLRRFGAYPLTEDDTQRAEANGMVNVTLGYQIGGARIGLDILNLLDEDDSDIQYYYASRLRGEPVGGVDDLHFHPAEPRQLRLTLSWGM